MAEPSICFICANIYPLLAGGAALPVVGGAEVQQYLMGQGLSQRGFRVCYISEDYGQGPVAEASGFRVLSFRLGWNKLVQAITLWRALRRAQAAIYYVRDMPKYGALIYLFCRVTGRKIVQALASDVEVEPENAEAAWAGWVYRLHAAWRRRADLVIAQTDYQAERLRARWHVAPEVVPNMVPVPDPASVSPRPAGCFQVLWVGRLVPLKRPEWLVEIARQLPELEFVVAGGQAREASDHYERVAALLRACDNVRWLGFVPYGRIDELFQSASVLLHTSRPGREGFPNVFLQAWAAGLPVVSTAADPNGRLARGQLGLLAHTVDEAAEALRQLAADPERCAAMGQRAREYVWATHRPAVVLPRLAGLFRALVEPV